MRRISCIKVFGSVFVALGIASCALLPDPLSQLDLYSAALPQADAASDEIIRKCHEALDRAIQPYGPVEVAVTGGIIRAGLSGAMATLLVTAVYQHQDGTETRSAIIDCSLDETGAVIAFTGRSVVGREASGPGFNFPAPHSIELPHPTL